MLTDVGSLTLQLLISVEAPCHSFYYINSKLNLKDHRPCALLTGTSSPDSLRFIVQCTKMRDFAPQTPLGLLFSVHKSTPDAVHILEGDWSKHSHDELSTLSDTVTVSRS